MGKGPAIWSSAPCAVTQATAAHDLGTLVGEGRLRIEGAGIRIEPCMHIA